MASIEAWAAREPGGRLEPFSYEPGPLGRTQVELELIACGICHSDLSMLENAWEMTQYPFVPGHENVGRVVARGEDVTHLEVGQVVGLGWTSGTCMTCPQCVGGDHNLCARAEGTIVGRHGGFADRVRCEAAWALPIPAGLDPRKVGPLFCGGLTVFTPLLEYGISPTARVGVVGIGGLGHLALQFANRWGCEVTAFTSTDSKAEEARRMGAHAVVNSRSEAELDALAGSFDLIIATVNVPLDWERYLTALAPKGRLQVVGAVLEPIPVEVFALAFGQKQISGNPVGNPTAARKMLDFCARHGIAPITEHFPLARVNEALDHLRAGKARYRIVLDHA